MSELGMDPEQVLAIAQRLDSAAHRVDAVGSTVDRIVAGMPAVWLGQDARGVAADWSARRASLRSAAAALQELASKARTNAHEQLRTSREYGSVGAADGSVLLGATGTLTAEAGSGGGGCLHSSLRGIGHFFEGAGEALGDAVKGIGTFVWDAVGLGGWEKFKGAWEGLGTLALLSNPLLGIAAFGPKGYAERVGAIGKSLVDWDEWSKDPARAAGYTFANLATLAVPGAGEVDAAADGLRGAELAEHAAQGADVADHAGQAGHAGEAGSDAGHAGEGDAGHGGSGGGDHGGSGGGDPNGGHPNGGDPGHSPTDPDLPKGQQIQPWELRGDHEGIPTHDLQRVDADHRAATVHTTNSNDLGKFGERLTEAEINRQGLEVVTHGRPVEIPGSPGRYFVPDFIVRDPESGKVFAIESKFGPGAHFTPGQLDGYPKLADGNPLVARSAGTQRIFDRLGITKIDGVQVYRWQTEYVPDQQLIDKAGLNGKITP